MKSFLTKKSIQETRLVTQISETPKQTPNLKRYKNKQPCIINQHYKTNLLSIVSDWKNQQQQSKAEVTQLFHEEPTQMAPKQLPIANFKPVYKHELDRMNQDVCVNQYTLSKILGKGAQGIVKLGSDTKKLYAVKIINCEKLKKKFFIKKQELEQMISVQVNILKSLNHPNIIKLYEALYSEEYQKLFIVLEYCGKGSILNLINTKDEQKNREIQQIKRYFKEMADAVNYMHDNNVVHRDIKAQNILLNENYQIKFCDFNVSSVVKKNVLEANSNFIGTKLYAAPQLLIKKKGLKYDPFETDIWSLGITLLQLLLAKHPFASKSLQELQQIVQNKIILPQSLEPPVKDLLQRMLQIDWNNRINIKDIMQHEWVK